ncbi:MAG: MgtC/SapB family protein [Nanoarchaeota archaeon]
MLLGALRGVQREVKLQRENRKDFAGFRTFSLISLLGFVTSYISLNYFQNQWFFIVFFICFFILIIVSYVIISFVHKNLKPQISGQINAVFALLIGFLVSFHEYYFAIFIAITIVTLMALGRRLHYFARKLKNEEIFATIKFAIISLIILPLLPNKNYSLLDIPIISEFFLRQSLISQEVLSQIDVFNFYKIWLVIVLVSAISYVGYILIKFFGSEKGTILTGFLGGLMSSTILTISFSSESKKNYRLAKTLALGVIIACSTMFFRIILELVILNAIVYGAIFALFVMGVTGLIFSYFFHKKISIHKIKHEKEEEIRSPFNFLPALKFAIFFLFILFISKLLLILVGVKGLFIIAFLSGITDVDAITISLAQMAATGTISFEAAGIGIFIAAVANTLFKSGIAFYFGGKSFFKYIFISFLIILATGFIAMFI